ncbi:MAG: DUF4430 domain-containing protein [Phycisphaerales bacterium]
MMRNDRRPRIGSRHSALITLFLAIMLGVAGWSAGTESSRPEPHVVRLIVDYDDGVRKVFDALEWSKEMTALDALIAADRHARGIELEYRGSGATAFVVRIDDLENEGGGGSSRNWLFWVNTEVADRGAGSLRLQPDDVILWKYTAQPDKK